tara:strand:- start:4176 stop:5768 length:1593 start_codon:yes stop_codon:yes gene_type:complete
MVEKKLVQKKYRVCIPTAGIGYRVKKASNNLNKSLLSINNKAAISHIINCFPKNLEFVIPIGYKGHLVREYLQLAHPKIKFYFVNVKKFKGKGSGLGYTLLKAKKYLQCPFIFISCDTLISEKIKNIPNHNWIGYSSQKLSNQYRKVELDKKKNVKNFLGKNSKKKKNCKNYIGLAGIKDFKEFWSNMKKDQNSIMDGEVAGIRQFKNKNIKSYKFKWHDIGNLKSYNRAKSEFNKKVNNINILEKEKECIWFNDEIVIKYFEDKNIVKKRIIRSKHLKKFIPKILDKKKNMYSYKKFHGKIFSKVNDIKIFNRLLNHLTKFNKLRKYENSNLFKKKCLTFYKEKTLSRLSLFYKKFNINDNIFSINHSKRIKLKEVLNKINWNYVSKGIAGRYHGDLHFENIIYSYNSKKICFLDWRQDFANSLTIGDIYYDLAKLLHGLLISHEAVIRNRYLIEKKDNQILLKIKNEKIYQEYQKIFFKWIEINGYDRHKVRIITGLIFLNICALHHFPYSLFLYYTGKKILIEEIIK